MLENQINMLFKRLELVKSSLESGVSCLCYKLEGKKKGKNPNSNWLQSDGEQKSFEWHNRTNTKILPSAFCRTTVVVTKTNATTTNKSTTQVLARNAQLHTTINDTSRASHRS
jgi:hypothetical protein